MAPFLAPSFQGEILFELLQVNEVPNHFVRGEVVEQTHEAFEQQTGLATAQLLGGDVEVPGTVPQPALPFRAALRGITWLVEWPAGQVGCEEEQVGAMMIHLPDDLERFLRAEVRSGHFASENDAIAEAVRLLRQLRQATPPPPAASQPAATTPDPVWGALHDAADEMDEIVAEAMSHREQQRWRLSSGE
jgi:Arc/MetJ-type ribon-helix-helix transcriptional regulator